MGTSSSGRGPSGNTPLIPGWITDTDGTDSQVDSGNPTLTIDDGATHAGVDHADPVTIAGNLGIQQASSPNSSTPAAADIHRFKTAKRTFNKFVRSQGQEPDLFRKAFKSYVRKGNGGSRNLAKRMHPSVVRVGTFYDVISSIQTQGVATVLTRLNLSSYVGGTATEILSALTDIIFDESSPYFNIQDDSLTKQAYAGAIVRIAEEIPDLQNLTQEGVEIMMAIFIEETITTKLLYDIGAIVSIELRSEQEIINIENITSQLVTGLVRNDIMLGIENLQTNTREALNRSIMAVYLQVFESIEALTVL